MKYSDMIVPATQREKADPRQVENSAGGYVYEVDSAARLRRFLVLGTEGGTFYASQKDLTKENLSFLKEYAAKDPSEFYSVLVDVDANNVAPRHSTVLLALAVLYTHSPSVPVTVTLRSGESATFDTRERVKTQFTSFVRTGTHLFEFVEYVTMYRKWGRGLRSLIAGWYKDKDPNSLAYQIVKYRQRGGWTHRDLLRLAHSTKGVTGGLRNVVDYAVHGLADSEVVLGMPVIDQFEAVKQGTLPVVRADALPWEALPTESLTDPLTWLALLTQQRLPFTAMLRNLGRMTSIGVFDDPFALGIVVGRLTDAEQVRKARLHPFNVLTALKTYSGGHGFRGSLSWTPKQPIVDALDAAFYLAFGNVEPTGKRINIALDISGSMGARLMDSNVTAREASTAMAMATLAADSGTTVTTAFTSGVGSWTVPGMRQRFAGYPSGISEVGLSTRRRLDDMVRETARMRMGGTDCALPMLWALETRQVFDAFVIYTDNETWAGSVQPMDALRAYRHTVNPEARLIVVGMTSTGFSIADPQDKGALDLVGFDSTAPSTISNFIAGRF
jgi:60 kDa SS-A/Ro ribonucleoprotein